MMHVILQFSCYNDINTVYTENESTSHLCTSNEQNSVEYSILLKFLEYTKNVAINIPQILPSSGACSQSKCLLNSWLSALTCEGVIYLTSIPLFTIIIQSFCSVSFLQTLWKSCIRFPQLQQGQYQHSAKNMQCYCWIGLPHCEAIYFLNTGKCSYFETLQRYYNTFFSKIYILLMTVFS